MPSACPSAAGNRAANARPGGSARENSLPTMPYSSSEASFWLMSASVNSPETAMPVCFAGDQR